MSPLWRVKEQVMTKSELTSAIIFKQRATKTGSKRLIEAVVDDVFDIVMRKIIEDGEVKLTGFGTFSVFSFNGKPRVAFQQSTRFGEILKKVTKSNDD